jgi:hypothetical protein
LGFSVNPLFTQWLQTFHAVASDCVNAQWLERFARPEPLEYVPELHDVQVVVNPATAKLHVKKMAMSQERICISADFPRLPLDVIDPNV